MLKEAFFSYLQSEKHFAEHTIRAYQTDLKQLSLYLKSELDLMLFDKADVGKITHRILRQWMGELVSSGLGSRSVGRKLSSAKSYFGFLQRSAYLDRNPAKQIRRPGFEQKLPSFLREQETEYLFEKLEFPKGFVGLRDKAIMELLYGCGLRRAELISLQKGNLDTWARTIRVHGKGNKERLLPYGKAVSQALENYMQEADNQKISLGKALFVREDGQAFYPKLLYRIVHKYLSEVSSLQQKSPHVLRHTFATHLLERGADLNAIKSLLGHESLAATQVYTHNSIGKLKAVFKQAHPRAETDE